VTASRPAATMSVLTTVVALSACSSPAVTGPGDTSISTVAATAETAPVGHSGDAADDPAIWVNSSDPSTSLVIGNDKVGALETYALDGTQVQTIEGGPGSWGNVDVRGDLVAAWNGGSVRLFHVDAATARLGEVTDADAVLSLSAGEGLCLYSEDPALYAFGVASTGLVVQFVLADADGDGLVESREVRRFAVGSEAEGCAVDDETGALYVSEEDVGLWRYDAAPGAGGDRVAVDTMTTAGGHLTADVEGVTVAGPVVIASAQTGRDPEKSYFTVYDRTTNAYVTSLRVAGGTAADDCDGTDGVAAYSGDLGPLFPRGVFICQDGSNEGPGSAGNQDFKLVPFDRMPGT
jgi:myo-inositol-hexaphosphate 3-phosphohydrolase